MGFIPLHWAVRAVKKGNLEKTLLKKVGCEC